MHRLALISLLMAPACVHPGQAPLLADPIRDQPATPLITAGRLKQEPVRRAQVVEQARSLLDGAPLEVDGYAFEPDPVGFVRAAYWRVGLDLLANAPDEEESGMGGLFRASERDLHDDEPRPGDLVFFDDRPQSEAPHPAGVAVVELVEENGTVVAIGAFAQGARRIALNLGSAEKEIDADGVRLNDVLVGDHRATAAQLWRCYADPY